MEVLRARVVGTALLLLLGCWGQIVSAAGLRIFEESTRVVSPEPAFPLNRRVVIHGNTMVATSMVPQQGSSWGSAAFLFEKSATGAWMPVTKLVEIGPVDDIESNIRATVQGTIAAVSHWEGLRIFERSATGWAQTASLPRPPGRFGSDIAISAGVIVVGGSVNSGHLYRKNAAGEWVYAGQLSAGAGINDSAIIGPAVDIFADKIAIGSPEADGPGTPGYVYIYRRQEDGSWQFMERVRDHLLPSGQNAAYKVSILSEAFSEVVAFDDGLGGVSVFETDNDSWVPLNNLLPPDAPMGGSAESIDLAANAPAPLAIGRPGDEDRGPGSGSVTLHARQNEGDFTFAPIAKLLASDARAGLGLGGHVSLYRRTVATLGGGSIYLFELPEDLTQADLLQDDFEDGDATGWNVRSSVWSVVTSGGSRVYRQTLDSTDARTVLAAVDWQNQSIQADVRPLSFNGSDRWVALLARYLDDDNYYYVTLRNTNRVQLSKRINGTFQTLASATLTVVPNRDYRVRLEAVGTWLRVYVDSRLLLQARDTALAHGTVGMRTYFTRAEYDNIVVSPSPATALLLDDFESTELGNWRRQPESNWTNVASGGGRVIRQSVASGDARAIGGVPYEPNEIALVDQVVEARARPLSFISGQDPWFGLIARYRNDRNYVYVTVNRNGYISLRKRVDGIIQVFDTAPLTVTTGTWYALRLEAIGDRLRVYVNGRLMLEGVDSAHSRFDPGGQFGLMTSRASAEFDDVRAVQP